MHPAVITLMTSGVVPAATSQVALERRAAENGLDGSSYCGLKVVMLGGTRVAVVVPYAAYGVLWPGEFPIYRTCRPFSCVHTLVREDTDRATCLPMTQSSTVLVTPANVGARTPQTQAVPYSSTKPLLKVGFRSWPLEDVRREARRSSDTKGPKGLPIANHLGRGERGAGVRCHPGTLSMALYLRDAGWNPLIGSPSVA
ncbi:hypothetical protein R1flu_004128 [Riccia fluitans]|uniref:Uncharacterized protein n=1 Tax=Riccia fluitans TaxID=41844 RepID=A0ABD1YSE1_9MARC